MALSIKHTRSYFRPKLDLPSRNVCVFFCPSSSISPQKRRGKNKITQPFLLLRRRHTHTYKLRTAGESEPGTHHLRAELERKKKRRCISMYILSVCVSVGKWIHLAWRQTSHTHTHNSISENSELIVSRKIIIIKGSITFLEGGQGAQTSRNLCGLHQSYLAGQGHFSQL